MEQCTYSSQADKQFGISNTNKFQLLTITKLLMHYITQQCRKKQDNLLT